MNETGFESRDNEFGRIFRNFWGYLLLFFGVLVALWVIVNVYGIFTHPQKLTAFQELVSSNLETIATSGQDKEVKIVIPAEIFAYVIPLFLLLIASGIAGMLISGGVKLLEGDLLRLFKQMKTAGNKAE